MKNSYFLLLSVVGCLLGQVLSAGALPGINLGGKPDRVLHTKVRTNVLEVGELYLAKVEEDREFLVLIEALDSPYSFEQEEVVVEVAGVAVEDVVPEKVAPVVYDDASVLEVIASDFSKKVTGTMARGSTSYLQLKGGRIWKAGATFPASLPDADGQTFTITVIEVDADGYTLKLGEATTRRSYDGSTGQSRAVKFFKE